MQYVNTAVQLHKMNKLVKKEISMTQYVNLEEFIQPEMIDATNTVLFFLRFQMFMDSILPFGSKFTFRNFCK